MLSSILQAKILFSGMVHRLGPPCAWTIQPKSKPSRAGFDTSSRRLSCQSTHIMGRSYVSDLTLGQIENPTSHIDIAHKEIRGLQFALGRFGLRGIRILYQDGTHSSWLGDSSFCWIGIVYSSDLSKLNVIADVSDPYVPAQATLLLLPPLLHLNVAFVRNEIEYLLGTIAFLTRHARRNCE